MWVFLIVPSSELPFIMYPRATGAKSLDVFFFLKFKTHLTAYPNESNGDALCW